MQLTKRKNDAEKVLEQNRNELKILELSKERLVDTYKKYEDALSKMTSLSLQDQEQLIDLGDAIEELTNKTVQCISIITERRERLRNAPRPVYPTFSGDPLEFKAFRDVERDLFAKT